jgi:hypothetical protein
VNSYLVSQSIESIASLGMANGLSIGYLRGFLSHFPGFFTDFPSRHAF